MKSLSFFLHPQLFVFFPPSFISASSLLSVISLSLLPVPPLLPPSSFSSSMVFFWVIHGEGGRRFGEIGAGGSYFSRSTVRLLVSSSALPYLTSHTQIYCTHAITITITIITTISLLLLQSNLTQLLVLTSAKWHLFSCWSQKRSITLRQIFIQNFLVDVYGTQRINPDDPWPLLLLLREKISTPALLGEKHRKSPHRVISSALSHLCVSDPRRWVDTAGPECFAVRDRDSGGRKADPERHGI